MSGHGVLSLSRLENRNNPFYSDPALIGYHFETPTSSVGTIPFEVMVQNLGNTWQGNLDLELNYAINNLASERFVPKIFIQGRGWVVLWK